MRAPVTVPAFTPSVAARDGDRTPPTTRAPRSHATGDSRSRDVPSPPVRRSRPGRGYPPPCTRRGTRRPHDGFGIVAAEDYGGTTGSLTVGPHGIVRHAGLVQNIPPFEGDLRHSLEVVARNGEWVAA